MPEAAAKAISIYLLFAIGFKGGVSVADHGIDATLGLSLLAGILLSAVLPLIAYVLLNVLTSLSRLDVAAVAAHYGSISIVTFVAATSALESSGIASEGYMVAVAMEAPAILSALWLISRGSTDARMDAGLWREILLNGSIVLLVGAFFIGWANGRRGAQRNSTIHRIAVQGRAVPVPLGHGASGWSWSSRKKRDFAPRHPRLWCPDAADWQHLRTWCRFALGA